MLAREIQKKRRHKSVRALIEECPNAVRRLAPCLLMSPLSVAQYLDPGTRFDVVILDEASQITACDAVGVLARAAPSHRGRRPEADAAVELLRASVTGRR